MKNSLRLAIVSFISGLGLSGIFHFRHLVEMTGTAAILPGKLQTDPNPAKTSSRRLNFMGDWKAEAEAWAREDPAGFRDWLAQRGIPTDGGVLEILFLTWLDEDPAAAFTAALNFPRDLMRGSWWVLPKMLQKRMEQPGGWRQVLQWGARLDRASKELNGDLFLPPAAGWLDSAPPAEIASILAAWTPPTSCSSKMIYRLTAHWSATAPKAALEWMRTLPPALRNAAFRGYLEHWSATDPAAALDYLAKEGASDQRGLSGIPLLALAETDPQTAVEWWERNSGRRDTLTLKDLIGKWGARNAPAARDWAFGLSNPALKRNALTAWTATADVRFILDTLRSMPVGPDSKQICSCLLGDTGRRSYLYSGRYERGEIGEEIRRLIADPARSDITPRAAALTAHYYAEEDPRAAWDWALTLPENRSEAAAAAAIRLWPDKSAAAEAVGKLPGGPVKQAALESLK